MTAKPTKATKRPVKAKPTPKGATPAVKAPAKRGAKPKAAARKPGRPSKYASALVERIAARLATGEPMAQICRDDGMPAARTVREWIDTRPDVSAAIARAREEGFDAIAMQCLEIADDGSRDYQVQEDGREVVDHDHIGRSRLRVDTRLKLLAKWDPKRYGDKVQHADAEGNNLAPPQFIVMPVEPLKE